MWAASILCFLKHGENPHWTNTEQPATEVVRYKMKQGECIMNAVKKKKGGKTIQCGISNRLPFILDMHPQTRRPALSKTFSILVFFPFVSLPPTILLHVIGFIRRPLIPCLSPLVSILPIQFDWCREGTKEGSRRELPKQIDQEAQKRVSWCVM